MTRRFIHLVGASALALALVACGPAPADNPEQVTEVEASTSVPKSGAVLAPVPSPVVDEPQPPSCDEAPFGATLADYQAFIKNFSSFLEAPDRVLRAHCRIKYGLQSRKHLYDLGLTDRAIDSMAVPDLAIESFSRLSRAVSERCGDNPTDACAIGVMRGDPA
jgi:hypothetical protein